MIADLKAKLEGFDRKRIFTAATALVVAAAAGHFMQRGADGPSRNPVLSASVPGTPQTAAQGVAQPAPVVVAAGMITPPKPTPAVIQPTEEDIAKAAPVEPTDEPAAKAEPVLAPAMTEVQSPEVTRSASDPLLAVSGVAGDTASDTTAPVLAHTPQAAPEPTLEIDSIELAAADVMTDPAIERTPVEPSCEISFDATVQPGAIVMVSVSAPCNAAENVEFDHAGLKFSEQLGPDGTLLLAVPAMTETAIITIEMGDAPQKALEVTVPDFAAYERVAVMWKGATGLQLHVLEQGASYGEPGHVWAEAPGTPEAAVAGAGGFISVLGSTAEGYAADIYSYPATLVTSSAEPVVSIEAQVMENTCGGEISGDILRSNAGRAPTIQHLSMVVPGCDAVGEYLVLNNLPQDLKLARN